MAVIHISEAEAEGTLKLMLAMVRSGERVQLAMGSEMIAVVHPAIEKFEEKGLSSAIRWAQEQKSDVLLDDKFSEDLEQLILSHENEGSLRNPWED